MIRQPVANRQNCRDYVVDFVTKNPPKLDQLVDPIFEELC